MAWEGQDKSVRRVCVWGWINGRRSEAETGLQSQGREADLPRVDVFFLLTAERLPQLQRIESPRLIYHGEDRKKRMKNTKRRAVRMALALSGDFLIAAEATNCVWEGIFLFVLFLWDYGNAISLNVVERFYWKLALL